MFAPYCVAHGSRVLLPTSAITAIEQTDDGLVARFVCDCGRTGIWRSSQG